MGLVTLVQITADLFKVNAIKSFSQLGHEFHLVPFEFYSYLQIAHCLTYAPNIPYTLPKPV